MVVNSDSMEEVISLHHRKEEIADIKFSPGKFSYPIKVLWILLQLWSVVTDL
jgi:hypothetical protein